MNAICPLNWVFVAYLCSQQSACHDARRWQDCRVLGVFADETIAVDYQQFYCQQCNLPDCQQQPKPIRHDIISEENRRVGVRTAESDNAPEGDYGFDGGLFDNYDLD